MNLKWKVEWIFLECYKSWKIFTSLEGDKAFLLFFFYQTNFSFTCQDKKSKRKKEKKKEQPTNQSNKHQFATHFI